MDKLGELLNILKENKLNRTYDKIMADLIDIKSALSVINEEVNDAILGLLSEGKYEEVNKLTSILHTSTNVLVRLENLLNSFVTQEKDDNLSEFKIIKAENKDKSDEDTALEYSGIITSVKGLKIGAKVVHKSFGIGKVVSIEERQNNGYKILKVNFDSCGEKPFNCTPEILAKYFDITDKKEDSDLKNKKNSSERSYEIPEHLKGVFSKIESIIFRQDMKMVKEKTAVYYKYMLNGKIMYTITGYSKDLKMCFNIPYGKLIDTKNLLEDVSNKGHLGVGPYRLRINEQTSLLDIENFVKQAFNYYKLENR